MARSLFILTILINLAFGSQEFIFWADVNTKNNIISSEQIAFSKAMVITKNPKVNFLCEMDAIKDENTSEIAFLNLNKDKIFDCFALQKVSAKGEFKRRNDHITQTSNFKIFPIRFTIKFKPKSAIIGVFKSEEGR